MSPILLPGTLGRLPRLWEAPVLRCPEGLGAWFTEQGGLLLPKDAGDEGECCLWEDLLRTVRPRPRPPPSLLHLSGSTLPGPGAQPTVQGLGVVQT